MLIFDFSIFDTIWTFIIDNRQWLFSGAGLSILSISAWVIRLILKRKKGKKHLEDDVNTLTKSSDQSKDQPKKTSDFQHEIEVLEKEILLILRSGPKKIRSIYTLLNGVPSRETNSISSSMVVETVVLLLNRGIVRWTRKGDDPVILKK